MRCFWVFLSGRGIAIFCKGGGTCCEKADTTTVPNMTNNSIVRKIVHRVISISFAKGARGMDYRLLLLYHSKWVLVVRFNPPQPSLSLNKGKERRLWKRLSTSQNWAEKRALQVSHLLRGRFRGGECLTVEYTFQNQVIAMLLNLKTLVPPKQN